MRSTFISDKELVHSYVNGDESALEILIQRHKARIFGYIMKLTRNKAIANDVFQDTFVKVIHTLKRGGYSEEGKFTAWVMRVAHNLVIDHYRIGKKMPMARSTEEYDVFGHIGLEDVSYEKALVEQEINSDLEMLIETLPKTQKEVLKMRLYKDMSFKDIAKKKKISINTALGRMRYAIIAIRKTAEEKQLTLSY